jgi:hypothetical protein
MTTGQLIVVDHVVALLSVAAWSATGATAAARRARLALGLLAAAVLVTLARVTTVAMLAGRGWWFVQEKVLLGLPMLGAAGLAAVLIAGPRLLAATGAPKAGMLASRASGDGIPASSVVLLFTAGYSGLAGLAVTFLVGYPPRRQRGAPDTTPPTTHASPGTPRTAHDAVVTAPHPAPCAAGHDPTGSDHHHTDTPAHPRTTADRPHPDRYLPSPWVPPEHQAAALPSGQGKGRAAALRRTCSTCRRTRTRGHPNATPTTIVTVNVATRRPDRHLARRSTAGTRIATDQSSGPLSDMPIAIRVAWPVSGEVAPPGAWPRRPQSQAGFLRRRALVRPAPSAHPPQRRRRVRSDKPRLATTA